MSDMRDSLSSNTKRDAMPDLRQLDSLRTGAQNEGLRQQLRELCKNDLYFLCKGVLNYDRLVPRTHMPVCKFMQDLTSKKKMLLLPRGCYKTTIGTIGLSIFILINDPNARILIVNQTATNAERMLLEIEQHLDGTNSLFRWIFPELCRPSMSWTPWSSAQMSVPNRTIISGTPSITAIGVGARMESQHFDWILEDDPVGENAMQSDVEMESTKTWHTYSDALFVEVATGKRRVLGTRWGHNDLYGAIIRNETGWDIYHKPARDYKTGELLFPEKLNDDTLNELMAKNYKMYLSQYQNDDSNPEALDFKPDWIQRYKLLADPQTGRPTCVVGNTVYRVEDMNCGIFIDTAASGDIDSNLDAKIRAGNVTRSNNAVEVWGIHGSGKMFMLDCWVGRGRNENPELQIAEKIYEMFTTWDGYIPKGYVEAYGAHASMITVFNMVCQQHGKRYIIEPIRDDKAHRAKDIRIRSTVGAVAANKDIFIRESHDQFFSEYCTFPDSETKDTLDAAAYAIMKLGIRKPRSPVAQKIQQIASEKKRAIRMAHIGRGGY
jgi:hypothetical protein